MRHVHRRRLILKKFAALTTMIIVWLFLSDSAAAYQSSTRNETRLAVALDRAMEEEVRKGFSGAVLVARGKAIMLDRAYGSIAVKHTERLQCWIERLLQPE